jgi:RNA polymerase sigma-70 factor (ECF subfamily)
VHSTLEGDNVAKFAETSPRLASSGGARRPLWGRGTPGKPDAELLSDADLLELTALGDRKAFARLYHSVSPRVSAAVHAVLDKPSTAMVHEVFVDVWQLAPQFEEVVERRALPAGGVPVISGADSTAWILKVARRRAVDGRRSGAEVRVGEHRGAGAGQHRGTGEHPVGPHLVGGHTAGQHLVGGHLVDPHPVGPDSVDTRRPRECKLTGAEREALALAFGGGYTDDEVAVILDEHVATVRTRLNRGLMRLQSSPRARRGGPLPADNSRRAHTELEQCAPCRRSAQLLLEPSQRGAGEAAASILRSLPTKG